MLRRRWAPSFVALTLLTCGVASLRAADSPGPKRGDLCVCCVEFSPDGKRIAAGCTASKAIILETSTGRLLGSLRMAGQDDHVLAVAFSPDNRFILTGSLEGAVTLWDADNLKVVHALHWEDFLGKIEAVAFRRRPKLQAIAGGFNRLVFWDVESGERTKTMTFDQVVEMNSIAVDRSENRILVGDANCRLELWDTEKANCVFEDFDAHDQYAWGGTAMASEAKFAAAVSPRKATIWDLERGTKREVPLEGRSGYAAAAAPNGLQMAFGQSGGRIFIWDIPKWQKVASMAEGDGCVVCLGYSPDGRFLLSDASEGGLNLWDVATGKLLQAYHLRLNGDDETGSAVKE